MKKSIFLTVAMCLICGICGFINFFYMIVNEYYATLPVFLISVFFLIVSITYFVLVDLKVSLPIVILWILILLDSVLNLFYYFSDVYIGINLILDVISQPFVGMMFLTNSSGTICLSYILSICMSFVVLAIPMVRLIKQVRNNR